MLIRVQMHPVRVHRYHSTDLKKLHCIILVTATDPCMGSGHILCYLFDVLMQIYESQGYSQRDAAQSIVQHNLYGLDIDRRATQLACFSVMMKARQYDRRFLSRNLQPMVYSTTGDEEGENFGSLVMVDDPGEMPEDPQTVFEFADYEQRLDAWNYRCLLAQKYHVVVTNPPYMGGAGMNGKLAEFVKKNYPDSKSDLSTAFMEKTLQLCISYGFVAMINIPVWMFLSSYEKLRAKLLSQNTISSMVHPGRGIFGSDFGTTTFIILKQHIKNYTGAYRRLFEKQGDVESIEEREKAFRSGKGAFSAQQDNFSKIPGSPVAYWVSERIPKIYLECQTLERTADVRHGLSTGKNDLFVRFWTEVSWPLIDTTIKNRDEIISSNGKWFPYNKGGEFRKWYGNADYVLWYNADGQAKMASLSGHRHDGKDRYFQEGITWSFISSSKFGVRYTPTGFAFDVAGSSMFFNADIVKYVTGLLCSHLGTFFMSIQNPTLNFQVGNLKNVPLIIREKDTVDNTVNQCIQLSRVDWDSFETSWDFTRHPLVRGVSTVAEAFAAWEAECEGRFQQLKANEEELNRIFIDIYGLQDELTPEVEDKDVTVRKADLGRDIRSLISYAVGCMFGRYSLDADGLAYAGGEWDASKYSTFLPDADGILPITDEEYLEDDIVTLLCVWLKKVYGADTLEENLDFIAKALGNKRATSREVIRNYFLKDFFADHCKIFQKRPIYWLFDSGKQNGFKALIYLHRYTPDTIGNVRIDYLHRMQRVYENEIDRMQDMIEHSKNPREVAASAKRREKLQKQLKECREYDEKISHLALSRIELDLDDGVKVNYRKMQTASDSKFYEVLADSKNIMGKK